jgi:PAS domain S-box-containing protein
MIASSDDAIISKDVQGTIMSWNPAAERMFGYEATEAIGQSIRIIIPADRQDEETAVLDRIKRGETISHYETVRIRKDGTSFPISLTVSPIRHDGIVIGASKIARDISDRKQAEAAADREKSRIGFLAQMAEALSKSLDYERTLKSLTALRRMCVATSAF